MRMASQENGTWSVASRAMPRASGTMCDNRDAKPSAWRFGLAPNAATLQVKQPSDPRYRYRVLMERPHHFTRGGFSTGGGDLFGYLHHVSATQRQHSGRAPSASSRPCRISHGVRIARRPSGYSDQRVLHRARRGAGAMPVRFRAEDRGPPPSCFRRSATFSTTWRTTTTPGDVCQRLRGRAAPDRHGARWSTTACDRLAPCPATGRSKRSASPRHRPQSAALPRWPALVQCLVGTFQQDIGGLRRTARQR